MRYIEGEAPIVLVAPHGGRRPADAPILDSIKVNDLHTAALTTLLAHRTGSYALVNCTLDRNQLDLNRISQVRTHAPWFLAALEELVSTLAARHGTVYLYFLHGWNVVQPVCDLGMGLRQRGDRILSVGKAAPTVSREFFSTVLLPFRLAARAQGVEVAFGRRYPAADKENVLQVFSARCAEDHSPAIRALADLARHGRIEAVQLELGVGLRWPGATHERFIEVFCHTLGRPVATTQGTQRDFSTVTLPVAVPTLAPCLDGWLPLPPSAAEPTRVGLHFHDRTSGLGIIGGIECDRSGPLSAGRLLLSLGGTEMALFTGEDDTPVDAGQVRVGDFKWQRHAEGLAITYRGGVMRFRHPQAFIRLEEGLAASWLEEAEIALFLTVPRLPFSSPLPLSLSHLRGTVRLSDGVRTIDAWGFVDFLPAEETGRLLPRRFLALPFGPDLGVFLSRTETTDGLRSSGVYYHDGTPSLVQPEDWELHYTFADSRPAGFRLALTLPEPATPLHCNGDTLTAIPIVRHTAKGSALSVTFGLARAVWQGREAYGVYEVSEWRKET